MLDFNFVLLHVADSDASAAFYSGLLGVPIAAAGPGFSALPLRDGVTLGLWLRDAVEPKTAGGPGASEIAFAVADKAAVAKLHQDWKQRGLPILQPPTDVPFGTTFTAADPDGHRLRVVAPPAA